MVSLVAFLISVICAISLFIFISLATSFLIRLFILKKQPFVSLISSPTLSIFGLKLQLPNILSDSPCSSGKLQ